MWPTYKLDFSAVHGSSVCWMPVLSLHSVSSPVSDTHDRTSSDCHGLPHHISSALTLPVFTARLKTYLRTLSFLWICTTVSMQCVVISDAVIFCFIHLLIARMQSHRLLVWTTSLKFHLSEVVVLNVVKCCQHSFPVVIFCSWTEHETL